MNHNDIIDKFCENPQILKELEPFTKSKDKLGFINKLVELVNCDFNSAKLVCDYIIDGTPLPTDLSPQEIAHANAVAQEWQNKPKCISCGSTNIKKISGLSKAGSVAVWGVFAAGRTSKTWHCNNCGTEW